MIKEFFYAFCTTLLVYLIMDGIWLGLIAKQAYLESMQGLLRDTFPIMPWILFYIMYSFAIVYLTIKPYANAKSVYPTLLSAAILGMAAYGAYNLTNYAIIQSWPWAISIKDWLWGIVITTVSSGGGWRAFQAARKTNVPPQTQRTDSR